MMLDTNGESSSESEVSLENLKKCSHTEHPRASWGTTKWQLPCGRCMPPNGCPHMLHGCGRIAAHMRSMGMADWSLPYGQLVAPVEQGFGLLAALVAVWAQSTGYPHER